jgi:glycosyltransferase involved in cell wall biosynthesis
MENLLRIWKDAGYAVTFIAIDYPGRAPGYTDRLERNGIEAVPHPYFLSVRDHLRFFGSRYDVVQLVRGAVAKRCLPLVRRHAPRAKVIFDTVDLHFLRWSREAELTRDRKLAKRAHAEKEIEIGLVRSADFTFVVSESDRGIVEKEASDAKVVVVSNIHADRSETVEPGGRDAMCFIGTYGHPPNLDAARFLLDDIMPLVRVELPGARLYLIGPDPPPELHARAENGVEVTGHVPDLAPLLARCRLSVAPLRFGAGVKGKLNTSMSFGVPVVATSLAAEGMHLVNGHDVLLGEDPKSLASAIVRLFRDDALWRALSTNGRRNVARHFSFDLARSAIAALTNDLPPPLGPVHGVRVS